MRTQFCDILLGVFVKTFYKIRDKTKHNIIPCLLLLLISILGFLAVRTVLVGGEIAGWDHSFHFTNSYLTYRYFIREGYLLGYDSWHMYGWNPNMYYNPGTTYFVVFMYFVAFPLLDFKTIYTLCVVLSYVLLAPALYLFVYSLSGSKFAAWSSALIALTIFDEESSWTSVGWRQVHYIGMWPQRMGLVTGIFALGLFLNIFQDKKSFYAKIILLIISSWFCAWSLLSHVMMGIATLFAIIAILLFKIGEIFFDNQNDILNKLRKILGTSLITCAYVVLVVLSLSFWIVPLLETNDVFHGLYTLTWAVGPKIINETLNSYPSYFNIFIFIGPFMSLYRSRRRSFIGWVTYVFWCVLTFIFLYVNSLLLPSQLGVLGLLLVAVTYLLFIILKHCGKFLLLFLSFLYLYLATGPESYFFNIFGYQINLNNFPFFKYFAYAKFAGFARYILLAYFSIVACELITGIMKYALKKRDFERPAAVIFALFVALTFFQPIILGFINNTDLLANERYKKFRVIEEFPLYKQVDTLVHELPKIVKENNTYILIQDLSDNFADWKTFCHNHLVYEIPLIIHKPLVGGIVWTRYITQPISTTEYSKLFSLPNHFFAQNPLQLSLQMRILGISYIVIFDSELKESLRKSNYFEEVYSDGLFSVFKVKKFNAIITISYLDSLEANITNVKIQPNHIEFKLIGKPGKHYRIQIRMVNFPSWRITTKPKVITVQMLSYNPYILNGVSKVWGYPVGSKIPFIELEIVPSSPETLIQLSYNLENNGKTITIYTLIIESLVIIVCIVCSFIQRHTYLPKFKFISLKKKNTV